MNMEALLVNKIRFLGLEGYTYTLVILKNPGFILEDLTLQEAKKLDLPLVHTCYYGRIYASDGFKNYLNNNPDLKKSLLHTLKKLDS